MQRTIDFYQEKASEIRKLVLKTLHIAKGSFNGGSLSAVDLLTVLFFGFKDQTNVQTSDDRDMFILSKGHCSSALYSALVVTGKMPEEKLSDYGRDGSTLGIHPKRTPQIGIEVSSGSLGHGLALATGSALAAKIRHTDSRVFVLMGDGECNEGSVWENAAFASRQALDNLIVIVDRNKLQGCGRDEDVLNYGDMAEKFRAFGFYTLEINGHDFEQIDQAFEKAMNSEKKPTAIIAHTIKGKGVSFMEDKLEWHYKSTTEEQYLQAMGEIV